EVVVGEVPDFRARRGIDTRQPRLRGAVRDRPPCQSRREAAADLDDLPRPEVADDPVEHLGVDRAEVAVVEEIALAARLLARHGKGVEHFLMRRADLAQELQVSGVMEGETRRVAGLRPVAACAQLPQPRALRLLPRAGRQLQAEWLQEAVDA